MKRYERFIFPDMRSTFCRLLHVGSAGTAVLLQAGFPQGHECV